MRFLLLSLGLGLLAAITGAPGVPAASMPAQFYETTAVTDTPDDFAANGALDIVAVHVAEKYSFDLEESVGRETVQFRLQLRNRNEIEATAGQANVTYILGYKIAGTATELSAELTVTCSPGSNGFVCTEPAVPKPHSTHQDFGVTFIVDAASNGLVRGVCITDIYAMSATSRGNNIVYQDLAPKDNKNVSEREKPTPAEFGEEICLQGTYPFIAAQLMGPSGRFAVAGGAASYVALFRTAADLEGIDNVRVFYQAPPGWTVSSTVEPPVLIAQGGGEEFDLGFNVKAPAFAKVGDTATVILDAVLTEAGGRALVATTTTVTEARVNDPLYSFALSTPGPFKSGQESPLVVALEREGTPLLFHTVRMDFIKDGQVADTVTATGGSDGTYAASYAFASAGTWAVDVYVADYLPAPHATFPLEVTGDGGRLPAFEWTAALGALGLVLLAARRPRSY